MITINEAKKAEIDARKAAEPVVATPETTEIQVLKDLLIAKGVLTEEETGAERKQR